MLITRFCLSNVYSMLKANQTLSNFWQTRVLRPPDSQFKPFIIWRLNHMLGCWTGTNHISFSVRLEGSICEVLRLNIPRFRANRLWVYLRKYSWQDQTKIYLRQIQYIYSIYIYSIYTVFTSKNAAMSANVKLLLRSQRMFRHEPFPGKNSHGTWFFRL